MASVTVGGITVSSPDAPPAPLPPGTQLPGGFIQPSGGFAPTSGPGFPTNPTPITYPGHEADAGLGFTLPPANVSAAPVPGLGGIPANQVPFPVVGGGGPTVPQFVTGPVPTFGGAPIEFTPITPTISASGDIGGGVGAGADMSSTFAMGLQPGGALEGNTGGFETGGLTLSPDLTASVPPEFTTATNVSSPDFNANFTPPSGADQLPVSPDIAALGGVGSGAAGASDLFSGIPGIATIGSGSSIPGSPLPVVPSSGGGAGFWNDVINVMQRVGLVLVGIVLIGAAAYAMSQTDIQSRTRAAFT